MFLSTLKMELTNPWGIGCIIYHLMISHDTPGKRPAFLGSTASFLHLPRKKNDLHQGWIFTIEEGVQIILQSGRVSTCDVIQG